MSYGSSALISHVIVFSLVYYEDSGLYEALVAAYGRLGKVEDAFSTFHLYEKAFPDSISLRTFTGLLMACRAARTPSRVAEIDTGMKRRQIQPDEVFSNLRAQLNSVS